MLMFLILAVAIQPTANYLEVDGDQTTLSQHLAVFAQNLEKSVLTSAWFNDQKDDEYNPAHDHTGVLSGVLYLKIPEYLPSRKHENADGSIVFISNEGDIASILANGFVEQLGATNMHALDGGIQQLIQENYQLFKK